MGTKRLRLRKLTDSDDQIIYSFHSDLENRKYIDKPAPKNVTESRGFIKNISRGVESKEWIYWGIELKKEKQLIGTICLWHFSEKNNRVEVGYELGAPFQRKGYMCEALEKVIHFAFHDLQVNGLEAYTHAENRSSQKLLEKYNFKKEKEFEEKYAKKEGVYKMAVYLLESNLKPGQ